MDERPPSPLPSKDLLELDGAATTIQSNFRGYKARKRLRREDAMQRTTISMERAFFEDGLRHTGEFHDCIPLPLDFPPPDPVQNSNPCAKPKKTVGMMFGLAPGVPILQFGMPPKITDLVDLVVLKDELTVENGYLNFITSVEDPEKNSQSLKPKDSPQDGAVEGDHFVSLSPRQGVIIEEITSLEAANILREIEEKGNKSLEVNAETEKAILAGDLKPDNGEDLAGISKPHDETNILAGHANENDDAAILAGNLNENGGEAVLAGSSNQNETEHNDGKNVLAGDSNDNDGERILAGDSNENGEKPCLAGDLEENDGDVLAGETKDRNTKDTIGIDIVGALEAPLATLGFPMKQGKLLSYGSEDSMAGSRRPLLEVTLTPGDPMKSLSLSQESQLAGERIESPITMMQIAPGRSVSLMQDDSGENLTAEERKEGEEVKEAGERKEGKAGMEDAKDGDE